MSEENGKKLNIESESKKTVMTQNAWIVKFNSTQCINNFTLTLGIEGSECQGIHKGDSIVIYRESNEVPVIVAFARLYQKRSTFVQTTFYFDSYIPIDAKSRLEINYITGNDNVSIKRLDWTEFESIFRDATGADFSTFPTISGESIQEQAYIRNLLENAVRDDLLGPANGPYEEIIGMSVRDRYLVGRLAPKETFQEEYDDPGVAKSSINPSGPSGRIDDEESNGNRDVSSNKSLVPSSVGLTFCVEGSVKELDISVSWGRYIREKSEKEDNNGKPFRAWKRIPSGGIESLQLKEGIIKPLIVDEDCPEVLIQGTVYPPLENGDRLVTLFLVNTQEKPEHNQDKAWIFQPEIIITDPKGKAVFRKRPVLKDDDIDDERETLEMIYRKQVEFAVGHGISVHSKVASDDKNHAIEIRTSVIPSYEIPVTETPGLNPEDRVAMRKMVNEGYLDMENLATLEQTHLTDVLSILTDDYQNWIEEQKSRIGKELKGFDDVAWAAMSKCEEILKRLREGIIVLSRDKDALEAFRFANKVMASQRIRSIYSLKRRRGDKVNLEAVNIPKNRSWRPFQLAFLLLSIPALSNPTHKDRTESVEAFADLLWFPTGGGKTEAYLGVAAFTMAIRRKQGNLGGLDASRGLSVIMRYTLRLLTLQQFQRATTLICAMEVLRKKILKYGGENRLLLVYG
ncbi:hypothetical protein PP175_03970 [Aneurinibacillus sp. Ricciae_BoGa-3]|uniref:hypothetical protein n=1 Tax=Aneurinibacillus sp. Ricciae_BoGa-3 TaxID=3022697 RepID=UPI00234003CF|nr:hypothetical protein [Aneurinibacillus sp. Ricciae_BoGa-3]WCK55153.1 hypothetical protein PP175_03970 [Aneurinibacillus sp. Ricciae_BoGa-3]